HGGFFTVEAWIKPLGPTTRSDQTFISSRWPDTEYTFDLKLKGSNTPGGQQLYADIGDGTQWGMNAGAPFAYFPGPGYHVALTSGDGVVTFYVNGQEIGSQSGVQNGGDVLFGSSGIAIGDNPRYEGNPDGEFFDGDIDEVALYPSILTPTEIATHYAIGKG